MRRPYDMTHTSPSRSLIHKQLRLIQHVLDCPLDHEAGTNPNFFGRRPFELPDHLHNDLNHRTFDELSLREFELGRVHARDRPQAKPVAAAGDVYPDITPVPIRHLHCGDRPIPCDRGSLAVTQFQPVQ